MEIDEMLEPTITPEQAEAYTEIYEECTTLANLPAASNKADTGTVIAVAGGAIAVSVFIAWAGAVMTRRATRRMLGTKAVTDSLVRSFRKK